MPSRVGALIAAAITLAGGAALAQQASDPAAAEAAFLEGLELMKAGRFSEACPKLEESRRLDEGIGVLLYLGECYDRDGRTASAWAVFREAEQAARQAGQTARADGARARVAALEARLPRLTIVVDAPSRAPGLEIWREGRLVGTPLWGSAVPVDPGRVVVRATAPGHAPFEARIEAAEGQAVSVRIPALSPLLVSRAAPFERAPAAVPAPPPEARREGFWSTPRVAGGALAGVGLLGTAVGAVFGLMTFSSWNDAEAGCSGAPLRCNPDGLDSARDAATFGKVSTVAFVAGGGLLAAGIVLAIVNPGDHRGAAAPSPVRAAR